MVPRLCLGWQKILPRLDITTDLTALFRIGLAQDAGPIRNVVKVSWD